MFEELLTQGLKMGYEQPKTNPKSMERNPNEQVGCLGFLDSYPFLSSSLDRLVRSIKSFPITQSAFEVDKNCLDDELSEKLAHPYEYFILDNFQEPLNLTKEDFWSTLKHETPPDVEINRTQEIIKKFNTKTGTGLTMFHLQMDVLPLAEVFENFVEKSTLMYGFNPLYKYLAPGITWKAGLKLTNIKLDFIKDEKLLLLLENKIRGGISSVLGDRHVVLDVNKQILYIDANNLYGWAMSQYLLTGEFEKLPFYPNNYT